MPELNSYRTIRTLTNHYLGPVIEKQLNKDENQIISTINTNFQSWLEKYNAASDNDIPLNLSIKIMASLNSLKHKQVEMSSTLKLNLYLYIKLINNCLTNENKENHPYIFDLESKKINWMIRKIIVPTIKKITGADEINISDKLKTIEKNLHQDVLLSFNGELGCA